MMHETNTDSNSMSDEYQKSPLDDIISRVDGYIQDPKTVTVQTLQELKSELEDLKSYLDKEESPEGGNQDQGEHPGLAIMIGKMKGEQK